MKAVIYARVSTNNDDQLNSLNTQMKFFEGYLKENGYAVPEVGMLNRKNGTTEYLKGIYADEGLTGTSLKNRTAFKKMMTDAKLGKFDMVFTKSVARFGRSVEDTVKAYKDLKELGIGVYFFDLKVNSLDNSKEFIINLFASTAQEESNNKSSIVQFGIRRAQQEGIWTTGNPPYGYDMANKFLKLNKKEAEIVQQIFNMYYHEGYGTGKICRFLNNEGIVTKKGTKWSQITVSRMLENPIYTGKQVTHKKQIVDVNRKIIKKISEQEQIVIFKEELKIIDDNLFQLVQIEKAKRTELFGEIITEATQVVNDDGETVIKHERKLNRANGRHSNQLLFSNLLYCGNCGSSLKRKKRKAYTRKDGSRKELGYEWACAINDMYGKSRCNHRNSMPEEKIIMFITDEIKKQKLNTKSHESNLNNYIYTYLEESNIEDRISSINNTLCEIQNEIETNFRLVSKAIISDEEYKERNDDLQDRKRNATAELTKLLNLDKEIDEVKLKYREFLSYLAAVDITQLTNSVLKKLVHQINITTLDEIHENHVGKDNLKGIYISWKFLGKSEDDIIDDMAYKDIYINKLYEDVEEVTIDE